MAGRPNDIEEHAAFHEIADALGCSRQRIQQIEAKALLKCRSWCDSHGLAFSDLAPGSAGSLADEFAALADDAERDLI